LAAIASQGGKARAAKARAAKLSVKRRQAIAKKASKLGGQARAAALTPARRKEIARKAAAKRWGKAKRS
jgi:hypothetical protein